MKFLILNGPNVNIMRWSEPGVPGELDYNAMMDYVQAGCDQMGIETDCCQTNHEGDLVDAIQKAYFDHIDGIVFNPAAYTHTSVAIADAVKGVGIPTVEVHISEVSKREDFRRISYIRDVACLTVTGMGFDGYLKALDHLAKNGRKEK